MTLIDKNTTFWGYRRENGRVGVRNHVIILPLDDLSNSAAEAVAHAVKGTMAISSPCWPLPVVGMDVVNMRGTTAIPLA